MSKLSSVSEKTSCIDNNACVKGKGEGATSLYSKTLTDIIAATDRSSSSSLFKLG